MQMVCLDREVNELEVLRTALRQIVTLLEERPLHDLFHRLPAQRRDVPLHPQRDVHRIALPMRGPRAMRDEASVGVLLPRSPRARPRAAALTDGKVERELPRE